MKKNRSKKLYYNGTVYDPAVGSKEGFYDWIAVDGNLIEDFGKLESRPPLEGFDETFDLEKRFMMPSFIDPHSHFASTAFSFLQVSLDGCGSFEDLEARIRAFIDENNVAEGAWITANAYDHNSLAEKRHPRKSDLDMICPANPLVVHHQSGHMGSFSSLALEILGLHDDSSCPEGGTMEMLNGELTGYMEENAFIDNIKKVPMPSIEDISKGIIKARDLYHSCGITVAQEGMMVKALAPVYDLIQSLPEFGLDIAFYSSIEDLDYFMYEYRTRRMDDGSEIRFGGLKLFLDGSPQGRTAWTREPYLPLAEDDDSGYCGFGVMRDSELKSALQTAWRRRIQVLVHCNGDRAIEQLLDAAEELADEGVHLSELRPVIVHAQLMGRDQLDRVKELGFIPSYFAAHIYHWGEVHLENLGQERGSHISPLMSTEAKGIMFTMHQDSPVIRPDMMETLQTAVTRMTRSGNKLAPEESIGLDSAIRAVTINGAYQYFRENTMGSMEKGKRASFVMLDENPFSAEESTIASIPISGLVKDGKKIF